MACADGGYCQSEDPGALGRLDGVPADDPQRDRQGCQDDPSSETASEYEPGPQRWGPAGDLSVVSQVAEGLRCGRLSAREAAEQLEAYRDSREQPSPETTTETVRSQDSVLGPLRFQHGTSDHTDRLGDRIATDEGGQLSHRERQVNVMVRTTGAVIPSAERFVRDAQTGVTVYRAATDPHGETSSGQETDPPENRPSSDMDAGDAMSATLTAIVATVVLGQRAAEKFHAPRRPKGLRSSQDASNPDPGGGTSRPAGR